MRDGGCVMDPGFWLRDGYAYRDFLEIHGGTYAVPFKVALRSGVNMESPVLPRPGSKEGVLLLKVKTRDPGMVIVHLGTDDGVVVFSVFRQPWWRSFLDIPLGERVAVDFTESGKGTVYCSNIEPFQV